MGKDGHVLLITLAIMPATFSCGRRPATTPPQAPALFGVFKRFDTPNGPVRRMGFIDQKGVLRINYNFDDGGSSTHFSADGLATVVVKERYGAIDQSGNFVVPPRFTQMGEFKDGVSVACHGDAVAECRYDFIDRSGRWMTNQRFENLDQFSDGMARTKIEERFGFLDETYRLAIPAMFDMARDFAEGFAVVGFGQGETMKVGYIDKAGRVRIPPIYDDAQDFSGGLARVRIGNKCGYIDQAGNFKIPPSLFDANTFSEGLAKVTPNPRESGDELNSGFINAAGKMVIPPQYGLVVFPLNGDFHEGFAVICIEKCFSGSISRFEQRYGYIDRNGNIAIPPVFALRVSVSTRPRPSMPRPGMRLHR